MNISANAVENCRERNGSAADSRNETVDETLDRDTLGRNNGEPLIGESYSDYPSRNELSNPAFEQFIRDLLEHSLVGGLGDAVSELCGASDERLLADWLASLESAAELHSINTDEIEAAKQGPILETILGYSPPTDMVASDNPLLLAELYCSAGLSVAEICDVLESAGETPVNASNFETVLSEIGLLNGREEKTDSFVNTKGEINRPSSSGLTVNTSDF